MWKRLERTDMEKMLSEDEVQKLAELGRPDGTDPVQDVLDLTSDVFRGALRAKGHEIDSREHFTPPEYAFFILVVARWTLWTRFPMSPDFANDEARKAEYEFAQGLLKNPYIGTEKPDYSDDPSADPGQKTGGASVFVQPLRFPPWWLGQTWNSQVLSGDSVAGGGTWL